MRTAGNAGRLARRSMNLNAPPCAALTIKRPAGEPADRKTPPGWRPGGKDMAFAESRRGTSPPFVIGAFPRLRGEGLGHQSAWRRRANAPACEASLRGRLSARPRMAGPAHENPRCDAMDGISLLGDAGTQEYPGSFH